MTHIEKIVSIAKSIPDLVDFKHFEVERGICDFAFEMGLLQFPSGEDEGIDRDELVCPLSAKLPFSKITICCDFGLFVLQHVKSEKEIACIFYNPDISELEILGGIIPGACPVVKSIHSSMGAEVCFDILHFISHVLAVINEPRVVSKSNSGSRQERRAAERGMGFAVDAWTKVSWDLSKKVCAKSSNDNSFHKKPLHWRRGHFRRAQKGYAGAIQRPDAIRVEDRSLWWQWIDGQLVGHPAFGIVRSVHAPRISGNDIAKRWAA
jgi:hypothetical protein